MGQNSEKIIILSQTFGSARFTVNKAVAKVPIVYTEDSNKGLLIDGNDNSLFPAGTNFNILSLGFGLPFGFEFEKVCDTSYFYQKIYLYYKFLDGSNILIAPYIIPFQNYEISFNQFVNLGVHAKKYSLRAYFLHPCDPSVLMLNIPDSFNGLTFNIPIFLKIQSTYLPELLPGGD